MKSKFRLLIKTIVFIIFLTFVFGCDEEEGGSVNTGNNSGGGSIPSVPGFVLSAISGDTTESGGTTTFTIRLKSKPSDNVGITLSSSNKSEGLVSPSFISFTPWNWNADQIVIITGVDDAVQDGNCIYSIVLDSVVSNDNSYNGLNPDDVVVVNIDDETAGFTIGNLSGNTTEAGGTATFTFKLNSQPTKNVVISITSQDTSEGIVSPSTLTFTSMNWNANQLVTVSGVNDFVQDGNKSFLILLTASSADSHYNVLNPNDVSVINIDDETAGFTVGNISGNTTEDGDVATFTVKLNSQPSNNVTISVQSSNTLEGLANPSSLTFTAVNWNAVQVVSVTGINDDVQDGNQSYSVVLGNAVSSDQDYNGLNPPDRQFINVDNDSAGFTISPLSGNTTEDGGIATFSVKLNSQPTANVSITVESNRPTEGTVNPSSLLYNVSNWGDFQTVTITGVDDSVQDGNQSYTINLASAVSQDSNYNGRNPADQSLLNIDDDSAGVTVGNISGNTTENGGTATFSIRLNSQPTSSVVFPISSSNEGEGTVNVSSITFTPSNWDSQQIVTITGINDSVQDGNQEFTVLLGLAVSSDANYLNMNPPDVNVINNDDDTAGIRVSSVNGNTNEIGDSATFSVRLDSQPLSNVSIPIFSNDTSEGTVSPSSLIFTSANWSVEQIVTITGVSDKEYDGDVTFSVILGTASSSDSIYNNIDPDDVLLSNIHYEHMPTPGNSGIITISNATTTSMIINWTAASDTATSKSNLQYLLYQSSSDNINTVANMESNGTPLGNYEANILSKDVIDLVKNTTYYFNVIVKDEANNKSAYNLSYDTTKTEVSKWDYLSGSPTSGIDNAVSEGSIYEPNLLDFNNKLYAIWAEAAWHNPDQTHYVRLNIKVFNGDILNPAWSSVKGDESTGINQYYSQESFTNDIIEFNSKLYVILRKRYNSKTRIRVMVYNSNDSNPAWSYVDGANFYGLNRFTSKYAAQPGFVKFDSKLYAYWTEQNDSYSSIEGIRIAVYNGNDASPSWTYVSGNSSKGLNYNDGTIREAAYIQLVEYNSKLYATWIEDSQVRVAVYNGDDISPAWSFVEGDTHGLYGQGNYASDSRLVVHNSKLYAAWSGTIFPTNRILVSVYNGNDSSPSWTNVDGNSENGIYMNASEQGYDPKFIVFDSKLYLSWVEGATGSSPRKFIRIAVFNGNDSVPSWTFVDGGESDGFSYPHYTGKQHLEVSNSRLFLIGHADYYNNVQVFIGR